MPASFIDPSAFDLPDPTTIAKSVDATETALQRQDLEAAITKLDLKGAPMRKRLKRVPANGLTHEFTQRVSLGSPSTSFYADGALPNDGNTRYVRKGKQIKAMGEMGRVTGMQIAGGRNFADQKSLESLARMTSVIFAEEYALHYGDSQTEYQVANGDGTYTNQNLEFDGLDKMIRREGGIVIDASTFTDGAKLSIPLLNSAIQAQYDAFGAPTAIECSSREKRFFNELLQSLTRYNGDGVVHVERQLGTSVMYYDSDFGSLPIIPSRYIVPDGSLNTHLYVYCEATEAESLIEVAELKPLGEEPLAKIDDSERFMVNEYIVPICRAPQWQVVIDNLQP